MHRNLSTLQMQYPFFFSCRSSSNQIDGRMDYSFQDGDAIQPISFLNELRLPTTTTVLPETTTGFSVTLSNLMWVLVFQFLEQSKMEKEFYCKYLMYIKPKGFYLQIWYSSGHKQAGVQLLISSPQWSSGPQRYQHSPSFQRVTAEWISEGGECHLWE